MDKFRRGLCSVMGGALLAAPLVKALASGAAAQTADDAKAKVAGRSKLKLRLLFMRARGPLPLLIKLRSPDRRRLDDYLAQGMDLPDSVAGQWLDGDRPALR